MIIVNTDSQGRFEASSQTRWRKEVIRCGRWYVPHMDLYLSVDARRMDRWIDAFDRMTANGVRVDLTVDHNPSVEATRGRVERLYREGQQLMMEITLCPDQDPGLLDRSSEVSLELVGDLVDGRGEHYGEAITAVSLVRQPVVPGQGPFEKIAASRGGAWIFQPQTEQLMFTEAQLLALRQKLELPAEADAQAILERVDQWAARISQLSSQAGASDATEAGVTSLSRCHEHGEVEQLLSENRDLKLSRLVAEGCITPAVSRQLTEAMGQMPILLSRTDGRWALQDRIIAALADNHPVPLGRQTARQIATDRPVPGDDTSEQLHALTAQMIAAASCPEQVNY